MNQWKNKKKCSFVLLHMEPVVKKKEKNNNFANSILEASMVLFTIYKNHAFRGFLPYPDPFLERFMNVYFRARSNLILSCSFGPFLLILHCLLEWYGEGGGERKKRIVGGRLYKHSWKLQEYYQILLWKEYLC